MKLKLTVRRSNRWDVYPQNEPTEEIIVDCGDTSREIVRNPNNTFLGEAIRKQHPKWRPCAPEIVSIEELP